MGFADHSSLSLFAQDSECQVHWTAVGDHDPMLGLEAALPYLLDHAPATFAEPAPAVVASHLHAAA
ncbi:MAG: hypothetical protein J7598_20110 [Mitsuaria chitosanitabida]|uniref:hypothetical protein n=1 Tax=Roseateles chitosanitabidus TaxID=65048 RepID=UPI001B211A65|nr:hypothetical protein [Roseateles chitosanitabidus]MBO9688914.1 hypothetical protein [Roseateles chitosanitabidus]